MHTLYTLKAFGNQKLRIKLIKDTGKSKIMPNIEESTEKIINEENPNTHKSFKNITIKDVKKAIKTTPNKAPGDHIFPQHLKQGSEKLFHLLTILFNASINLGYFPDSWKVSIISMILKPDKPATNPSSYRPISLLPTLGKLLERIMMIQITHFMIQNNLLNHFQAGFQKQKSCVHQLL